MVRGSWKAEPVATVCAEFEAYPEPKVLRPGELARRSRGRIWRGTHPDLGLTLTKTRVAINGHR